MRLFLLLLFAFFAAAANAGTIRLEAQTAIFERPDASSPVVGRVEAESDFETAGEPVTGFTARHPLAHYNTFHPIRLEGEIRYASPEISLFRDENGRQVIRNLPEQPLWRTGLFLALAAGLVALVLFYLHRRREGALPRNSRLEAVCFVLFAVLIRQLLVLHTTMEWNNLIPSAADDPAYFQSIRDLLDGKLDGPWSMTVGTGFFYLPFILLLRAKEFYDIAIAFDYFSALVLAPAALALGFMILRRFGISGRAAFAAVLLWAVWPFFHTHLEAWEPFRCRSIFLAAPPSADSHWWLYYRTAINAGFNAMSDTPAMLLLFATIWSALTLPPRNRSAALIGVLFGFTCMVRINTILFAPLIAYLVFRRFRSRAGEWNAVLGVIASAAGGFLLGFGYQFCINIRQFGNPLTFGYISHYTDWAIRPADGFTFTTFLRWVHLRYLAQANWANWALGITGLLLAAGRTRRTAFALWTVPVIVFFTGYSHTFCDANRFIVSTLLPFFAAFTSLEIFREKGKLPWFFAGTVAAALLLTAPSSSQPEVPILLRFPAPAECTVLLPWLLAALLALLSWTGFRSGMRPLTAAAPALFAGLFFVGNSFLFLGLLGAILLRALAEWFLQWKRCAHRCRTP